MYEVMIDADFLASGLGGTNMMSMLWTVAMGRRAVGVEMRGDPFLGVHWNIREDFYHQLGLIDQMMLERYGEARIPRRGNGQIFRLSECFYSSDTAAGDIVADEIIDGFDADQHIVGTIHNVEFIDDRWRDGLPNRVITFLDIQQSEQVVQRIAIKEGQVVVGRLDPKRGITPEIDLTQFDPRGTVSRQHARIRVEKTHFSIEDLKSRNKTRLGELALTPDRPEVLQNGDVVSFGAVKATFRLLGTSELPVSWSQS